MVAVFSVVQIFFNIQFWTFVDTLPSSTVEDTCTVYKQEEDAQMEFTEIKGKNQFQI